MGAVVPSACRAWMGAAGVVAAISLLVGCGDEAGGAGASADAGVGDGGATSDVGADDTNGVSIETVVPGELSALGGVVRIEGVGLGEATSVRLGDASVPFSVSDGGLDVEVPTMTARVLRVVVDTPRGMATLDGGLRIVPLEPVWAVAPAWWSPDLTLGGATDLVAADTDGDGRPELWVAGPGGVRRVVADASGATADAIDAVDGPAGALLVLDANTDGIDDVFVCGGRDGARYYEGAPGGALARIDATPAASGACVSAALVDDDIVAVIAAGGGQLALRRYVATGAGQWTLDATLEPTDVADEPLGSTRSSDEGATLEGSRSSLLASAGSASGRFFYQLSGDGGEAVWQVPVTTPTEPVDSVELAVFGSATNADLALALVDAEGGRVEVPLGPDTDAAWRTVVASGVGPTDAWSGRPIAIELVVRPVAPVFGGEVFIDEIVGVHADGSRDALESFERASFAAVWPGDRASLATVRDASGATELLVAPGPDGACLGALSLDDTLPVAIDADVDGPCAAIAARDVDDDGDDDLWIGVRAAQDRWWINDGFGVWFDATGTTLPVDFADARGAAFGDLDLDGRLDVAVANEGQSDRCYLATSGVRYEDHTPGCGFDESASIDVAIADVNMDGAPDVVTVDAAGQLTLRLWTGGQP